MKKTVDMTKGSIIKQIAVFAFPLLLGNLFQQLYNMVDTYVIGQTHNNAAYAAVGSMGPIINILIGFFSGLATGAGAVISQLYGAKNDKGVSEAVHTSMLLTFVSSAAITVVGIATTPLMLSLMLKGETGEIYVFAKEYLTIYFAGVSGLLIYNMGSGILRAIGDSLRPFVFLIVSALTNIVLDCLFVFGFDMGAEGVAYATIISQFISAILVMISLMTSNTCIRFEFKKAGMNWKIFSDIVRIGIPAGLQMALTAFSNVFVQSYIGNAQISGIAPAESQSIALGSWTTLSKLDGVIFMFLQSISAAAMTFVGQNLGAGNVKRAKKGTYTALTMALASAIAIIVPLLIFAPQITAVFNNDPSVVANATLLVRVITPCYLFSCINQTFAGALRGAGNSFSPMIMMLVSFVGVRQVYLYIMSNFISNKFLPIAMGYPLGWFSCCIGMLICFFTFDYSKAKINR